MKQALSHIPSYYFIVVTVLVAQALFTVYHGGLVVGNGVQVNQLEKQKAQLTAQSQQLQQQLAVTHSLVNIQASSLYNQFQPIAGVIAVRDSQAVASR